MAASAISTAWCQTIDLAADASELLHQQIKEPTAGMTNVGSYRLGPNETLRISRYDTTEVTQGIFLELAQELVPSPPQPPQGPQGPLMAPRPFKQFYGAGSILPGGTYEQGKNVLDRHDYKKAVELFDIVIDAKTTHARADGACYWKAYALNKLGKSDEALAALTALSTKFPQSSWLNDVKVL